MSHYTSLEDPVLNYAMEIHDSQLKDFSINDDSTGFLLWEAVVYRSDGAIFKDAHEGGWQQLRMTFEGLRVEGELLSGEYSLDGDITINGELSENIIHLQDISGIVSLRFNLHPDFEMRVLSASKISFQLEGEFQLESSWDSNGKETRA